MIEIIARYSLRLAFALSAIGWFILVYFGLKIFGG